VVLAMFENKQIQFVTDKNIVPGSVYIEKTKDGFKIVDKIDYSKLLKSEKKCTKNVDADIIVD